MRSGKGRCCISDCNGVMAGAAIVGSNIACITSSAKILSIGSVASGAR